MSLLDYRFIYKTKAKNGEAVFEYPEAYEYFEKQNKVHWVWDEVPMGPDIQDWKVNLTETERNVIGNILKSFAQTEVMVNEYWASKVYKWFPKPEIRMMCGAFSNMEGVHTKAYAYLNEALGLEDYEAFLEDEEAKAKLDSLINTYTRGLDKQSIEYKKQIARSLAVFSAFTEGVNLFSSFAVLLSFSRKNKLFGVGNIVEWSVRDESMHSEAGCWLFREFIKENPEIFDDELKKDIYGAARLSVKLEDDFIDKIFELEEIESLSKEDLKQFIRHRANVKLGDLGLRANWEDIDKESLTRMSWFDNATAGAQSTDFFRRRVTQYSKGNIDWDTAYDVDMNALKENFGGSIE